MVQNRGEKLPSHGKCKSCHLPPPYLNRRPPAVLMITPAFLLNQDGRRGLPPAVFMITPAFLLNQDGRRGLPT